MARWAKGNLPGGSLKYQFTYSKIRLNLFISRCSYHTYKACHLLIFCCLYIYTVYIYIHSVYIYIYVIIYVYIYIYPQRFSPKICPGGHQETACHGRRDQGTLVFWVVFAGDLTTKNGGLTNNHGDLMGFDWI